MISLEIDRDRALDLTLFLETIEDAPGVAADIVLAHIFDEFNAERDFAGIPWAPLSPVTLAKKAGRGSILIDSGDMLDSLRVEDTEEGVAVLMDSPAQYHQFGTAKMPRRSIFPTGDKFPDNLLEEIEQTLVAKVLASLNSNE